MRWIPVCNLVGILVVFLGLSMALPLMVGLYYHDGSVPALLNAMGVTVAAGLAMHLSARRGRMETISHREGDRKSVV